MSDIDTQRPEVVEILNTLLKQGAEFTYQNFSHKSEYGYPEAFTPPFIAWETRVKNAIERTFASDSAPSRLLQSGLSVDVFGWGAPRFEQMHSRLIAALNAGIEVLAEDHFGEAAPVAVEGTAHVAVCSNRVFIVHGHDDAAKTALEVLLREIGLEPIVLHRQPDEGLTVIEKFEKYSDVGFVFVLLTPDEIAYLADQDSLSDQVRSKEWRTRPNVIFEFGYFVGRLGRSRVCCLLKSPVRVPSDIAGLLYKPFERSIDEVAYSLIKELRASGYKLTV